MDELPKFLKPDPKSGNLYTRVTVPKKLQGVIGKTAFIKRWGTPTLKNIEAQHYEYVAKCKHAINEAKAFLADQQKPKALPATERRLARRQRKAPEGLIPFSQGEFSSERLQRLVALWLVRTNREWEVWDTQFHLNHSINSPDPFEVYRAEEERDSTLIDRDRLIYSSGQKDPEDRDTRRFYANRILENSGYYAIPEDDYTSPLYNELLGYANSAMIELFERRLERMPGFNVERASKAPTFLTQPITDRYALEVMSDSNITWKELCDEALKDKENQGVKYLKDYTATLKLADEIFGENTPISAITREDCDRWYEVCSTIPANLNKKKEFKGMTYTEAAEYAVDNGIPPRSASTIETQVNKLKALFNHAVEEDYLRKSPARKLRAPEIEEFSGSRTYNIDQLNLILSSTQFQDFANGKLSGLREDDCWLILTGLYTGARLSELVTLRISDVRTDEHGNYYFDINQNRAQGKTVKTQLSKRRIPIHQTLIDMGILSFVERRNISTDAYLFDYINDKRDPNDSFSDRFRTLLKNHAGKKPGDGMCFHSFRHTVNHFALKTNHCNMDRVLTARTLGWKLSEMPDIQYGGDYTVAVLKENFNRLHYPGLAIEPFLKG